MKNGKISDQPGSGNLDAATVQSFGDEWARFDQSSLSPSELQKIFSEYFSIFPWARLPTDAIGFDMGCGSGRFAKIAAGKVGHLHCIDPSAALDVAKRNLQGITNVTFHRASVDDRPLPAASQDFGYSLGVLHHIPDTQAAISSCAALLKPGAPLLVYLYYAFDNRPWTFRALWRMSDLARRVICRLPAAAKHIVTDAIAFTVYWPLSRVARLLNASGINPIGLPLSHYKDHSLYTLRTDSRDRFGTPLEQRFTRQQIQQMLQNSGLVEIEFSSNAPYWCAVGIKA